MRHRILRGFICFFVLLCIAVPAHGQVPLFTKISTLSPAGTFGAWGGYESDGAGGRLLAVTGSYEWGSHATSVFKTYMANTFATQTPVSNLQGLYWSGAAWGDYDGDGAQDLVVIGDYEEVHQTILYKNNGSDIFNEVPNTGLTPIRMGMPCWVDFDGDSDLDLFLIGQRGGHGSSDNIAELYRNDGGVFVKLDAGLQGRRHGSAAWGDYDNDGDLDLLIMGTVGWDDVGGTILYRNDNGIFSEVPTNLPSAEGGTVAWGDYDNDGDPDVLINGTLRGTGPIARVYRNDDGVFSDIVAGLMPGSIGVQSAAWGDFDNDDNLDIAIATEGVMRVYRNQGGTFVEVFSVPGPIYGTVAWGDCNRDGLQDLLVVGTTPQYTSVAEIYRNNGPSPWGNIIYNGSFYFGLDYWQFYTNGVATASMRGESSFPCCYWFGEIQVTTPGSNTQLYQKGVHLQPFTQYRLSFSAFSSNGHDLGVAILKNATPFTNYGLNKIVDLPSGWSQWTLDFTTAGFPETVTDARLRFSIGPYAKAGDRYGISDVRLEQLSSTQPLITEHPEDRTVREHQLATFSVNAIGSQPISYQWYRNNVLVLGATQTTYVTPQASLADEGAEFHCVVSNPYGVATSNTAILHVLPAINMVNNAGFEQGTEHWFFFSNGSATFGTYPHVTPDGGVLCGGVKVVAPGTNVQLSTIGTVLAPNTTYQLSLDAYSNTGHNMSVYIHRNSSPYTNLGLSNWTLDLSTSWQRFVRVFTTPSMTEPTADTRLRFWFAPFDVAGDQFYVDNVWLEKVGPISIASPLSVPNAFSLNQNYPNPFNPVTMVSYELPVDARVSLKIYDMLGREMETLVDANQEAGVRFAEWNASGFPSGVYFCRMVAGTYQHQIKMMLIK